MFNEANCWLLLAKMFAVSQMRVDIITMTLSAHVSKYRCRVGGCLNVKQTEGEWLFICHQLAQQVSLCLRFNPKHL